MKARVDQLFQPKYHTQKCSRQPWAKTSPPACLSVRICTSMTGHGLCVMSSASLLSKGLTSSSTLCPCTGWSRGVCSCFSPRLCARRAIGADSAAEWCVCSVSWSSAETCWKPGCDTRHYLHSLVQDVRPLGLTANNPQGLVPGKMGHSIFREKLPNSEFFLASYVNCINRLLHIQGHTFWAIIFFT